MYLEQLKYLVELSKAHSIHAASKRLFLTPQALSMSLKALEQELGVTLLNRSNAGTTLTVEGELICELAQNVLQNIDLILNIGKEHTPKADDHLSGKMIIFSTAGASNIILTQIIKRFIQKYPQVNLQIMEENSITAMYQKLEKEENALALYNANASYMEQLKQRYPEERFFYRTLRESNLAVALSITHELSKKKMVSAKQLEKQKIVLIGTEDIERLGLKQLFCEASQLTERVSVYNSIPMYIEALTSGAYIGFLDSRYYASWSNEHKAQIVNLPLKTKIKILFGYFCKRQSLYNPCVIEFLKMLHYKYK